MTTALGLAPLAHGGEGASWQAMVTLGSLGLVGTVVLVALGFVRMAEPADLLLPVAAITVLTALSGVASDTLSDGVGWALPLGVVALVLLLLATLTTIRVTISSPVLWVAVVIAAIAAVALEGPLTRAWHAPAACTAPCPDGEGAAPVSAP